MRGRVQEAVARGRIDVTLAWESAPPGGRRFAYSPVGAAAMLEAWRRLQNEHGLADAPTAQALLRMPGVIDALPDADVDQDRLFRVAVAALDRRSPSTASRASGRASDWPATSPRVAGPSGSWSTRSTLARWARRSASPRTCARG